MPTYEIQLPDGRSFEVDSPNPPTEQDIAEMSAGPQRTDLPDDAPNYGLMAAGGAALAGGMALLTHKPGMMRQGAEYANMIRQQLMLTGLALPKSMAGNVGAAVAHGLETKSLKPLSELFSTKTLADAWDAYKANQSVGPQMGSAVRQGGANLPKWMPNPGRIMGAFDTATQSALQRGGMTAKEAEAALFQTPLGENFGKLAPALDSDAARYIFPFRRTPYNQFYEGLKTLDLQNSAHPGLTLGYAGAGAVHGNATSDEQYPMSIPLAAAGAAKYGVPYALGALGGRAMAGGQGGGGASGTVLPVSEYGLEQSIQNPLKPFTDPPAFSTLQRFFGQ